jgi:ATP-dependent RNA helicase RhlB
MNYTEFQLDPRLQAAIDKMGYTTATPIQEQTIPIILENKDVAGLAQTGTGKTAAFVIPLIERILKSETDPTHARAFPDWKPFQCILILCPTRELADQINDNIVKLTDGTGLKSFAFYGGTGYEKQKEALKNGLHFIVSTPGRLIDLYKEHHVDFKRVRAIIFDEADRMFDMGFKDDMKFVLGRVERTRQLLVFSATLNFEVHNTVYQFGSEPVEINISRDQAKAENVKDAIYHIGNEDKPAQLLSVIKKVNPKQVIIFTNFKNNVDRIAHFLSANNIPAMGLSSLMNQTQRNNVITKFKEQNNLNVLVATDVAARGLDINDVDLVINYEMPQDAESYVHRIGRTGRAGKDGLAFSFISEKDVDSLGRVEEYTKKKIETQYLEDNEIVKDFKPMDREDFSFKKSFDKRPSNGKGPQRGGPRSQGPNRDGGRPSPGGPRGPRAEGDRPQRPSGPGGGPRKEFKPNNGAGANSGQGQAAHSKAVNGTKPTQNPNQNKFKPRNPNTEKPSFNKSAPAQVKPVSVVASKKVYRKGGSASEGTGSVIKNFFRKIFG